MSRELWEPASSRRTPWKTTRPPKTVRPRPRRSWRASTNHVTAAVTVPSGASTSPLVGAALLDVLLPGRDDQDTLLLELEITAHAIDAMTGYGVAHGASAAFLGFVQARYLLAWPDDTVRDRRNSYELQ